MFPAAPDPKGNPETWTRDEMRRWLAAVSSTPQRISRYLRRPRTDRSQRNLHPQDTDTREQLLERVQANMRISRG